MEQRFGEEQVCSVGTYTTLQLKAALTDFAKLYGVDIPTIRRISKMINGLDDKTFEDFMKIACKRKEMKNFVNKYPELINAIFLVLGQPKAASIHACAMMIFPKEKTMFQWTPIRKQNDLMVSEWEGGELDATGFLKEDILGIEQLDKFTDMINLIEKDTGKRINLYRDIRLDDSKVYKAFQEGQSADLFHFGAKGLSKYVLKVAPENIDDLIACVCLYRPGPMENGYHISYLKRRSGEEEIDYPIGGEEILKDSYGLFYTQEHIMLLCQKLAGFSLPRTDDVRKAMGKKILSKLQKIEPEFIKGYVERYGDQGVDEEYAKKLWKSMEEFGKYAFNKSHAAAYSINGYNSMWFKVHYPVEFWSVTFSRASKDDYPFYIAEINKSRSIRLKSVDINKSDINIVVDKEDQSLYWPLNSVTQVGEKAQIQISNERKENGPYFSLDEFIDRHSFKGSSVNKSVIENLIYAGAFDEIEKTKESPYFVREKLIVKYREDKRIKINEEKDSYSLAKEDQIVDEDWWWQLKQKRASGYCLFDYESLCEEYLDVKDGVFCDCSDLENYEEPDFGTSMIGGYVLECEIKESKKGTFANLIIESNYNILKVVVWADIFDDVKKCLEDCEKNILLLNGKIVYSNYDEQYVLQTVRSTKIVKLSLL